MNNLVAAQLGPIVKKRKTSEMDNAKEPRSTGVKRESIVSASGDSSIAISTTAYNGLSRVFVVVLRVTGETAARPMPQSAFFSHDKALEFTRKILLQFCEAHYDDYVWRGPETLSRHCVSRYVAFHAQTGQQLVAADAIRVSIFDAKEAECEVQHEEDTKMREPPTEDVRKHQAEKTETATPGSMFGVFPEAVARKIAEEIAQPQASNVWHEDNEMKMLGGQIE